jgi:hypothetical protein
MIQVMQKVLLCQVGKLRSFKAYSGHYALVNYLYLFYAKIFHKLNSFELICEIEY